MLICGVGIIINKKSVSMDSILRSSRFAEEYRNFYMYRTGKNPDEVAEEFIRKNPDVPSVASGCGCYGFLCFLLSELSTYSLIFVESKDNLYFYVDKCQSPDWIRNAAVSLGIRNAIGFSGSVEDA